MASSSAIRQLKETGASLPTISLRHDVPPAPHQVGDAESPLSDPDDAIELGHIDRRSPELGRHVPGQEREGLLTEGPVAPPPRRPRRASQDTRALAAGDPFEFICTALRVHKAVGRNYILYEGRGWLITVGPHWSGLLFTVSLITTSTYFFIKNVCEGSHIATYIAIGFCICTLSSLLAVGCSNPGFVRTSVPEGQGRRRFCEDCQLWIGPGCAHCPDCNCCIEQLDHHCPWTGHCIGKKNMKYFVMFNCSWVSYVLFVFAMLIASGQLVD